jgi:glycerol kinase
MKYILAVDQSTQGTKGLLFDMDGRLITRTDLPHRQIINDQGWVEHDLTEIYRNTIQVVKNVVEKARINKNDIQALGISNQRETSAVWSKDGTPVYNAIVWQDARAEMICQKIEAAGQAEDIMRRSGIRVSPYFPAAKLAWVLQNVPEIKELSKKGELYLGTIDTYLVYRLSKGQVYRTDFSNASRTQLFNINTLQWDASLCDCFGVPIEALAEVTDSDGFFGETDFEGYLNHPIPIHGVLGDSHGALFGQGCIKPGMIKATYGTGSSIMMNVGEKTVFSKSGVISSLAWKIGGKVNYVLEGNINYTGAVITWLQQDLGLISSASESESLARKANPSDHSYLVPAFTGLGAPYWDSAARAMLYGMSRTTRREEIVRDGLDCIAYQITDILNAMKEDAGITISELRVDGGPTRNKYLMQFQSDIAAIPVKVSPVEELSGQGAAYAAGEGIGMYVPKELFNGVSRTEFNPKMPETIRKEKYQGWKFAVSKILTKG